MAITTAISKLDRVVFHATQQSFTVRDVIDAAEFRGELAQLWRSTLTRAAAEEKARQSGAELDDQEVNSASVAFRYKYDLITAEETEKWLEQRALTLSDFSDYFVRSCWEKTFRGRVKPPEVQFTASGLDQRELLAAELTMSGEMDRLSRRLAWRVAARATPEGAEVPQALIEEQEQAFRSRVANEQEWLAALGRDREWLDEMLAVEAGYHSRRGRVLTPEARRRELGAVRLPLTRFDVELVELESHGAAREAFLCVRDDGMSMEEVAREGRYPYRRVEMVLDQFDPSVQQKYLSSQPGTVMEPMQRGDGFQLSRLLGKREPSLEDADVLARVDQRLMARHFNDLASSRIQWVLLID